MLNLLSKQTIINNKTTIIPFRKPAYLVTEGLYRFTRNPMYLGMATILFGEAIVLSSISTFLFPLLFIPIINRKFIDPDLVYSLTYDN